MGGFGGNLTNRGLTGSLLLKNIEGLYIPPKTEFELEKTFPNFKEMSIQDIKNSLPKNWTEYSGNVDYWDKQEPQHFTAKDGQTNAYVKSGIDEEVIEYLDREETQENTWQIQTDDTHLKFVAGGKIIIGNREYFLAKVVSMQQTSTYQNKLYAMNTGARTDNFKKVGVKLLILV